MEIRIKFSILQIMSVKNIRKSQHLHSVPSHTSGDTLHPLKKKNAWVVVYEWFSLIYYYKTDKWSKNIGSMVFLFVLYDSVHRCVGTYFFSCLCCYCCCCCPTLNTGSKVWGYRKRLQGNSIHYLISLFSFAAPFHYFQFSCILLALICDASFHKLWGSCGRQESNCPFLFSLSPYSLVDNSCDISLFVSSVIWMWLLSSISTVKWNSLYKYIIMK